MTDRARFVIRDEKVRQNVINYVRTVPPGTRIEIRANTRTADQNARLHAVIREISTKVPHPTSGELISISAWKTAFVAACFHVSASSMEMVPSLPGYGPVELLPVGYHTADLTIRECTELMDFIDAWCAENNIVLTETRYGPVSMG